MNRAWHNQSMKIYVSHPSSINYREELYPWLREALSDYEFMLPHETHELRFSKQLIEGLDLVIAEIFEPSTGQGIELGWANAANVRIVALYRAAATSSASVGLIVDETRSYVDQPTFIQAVNELVA